MVGFIGVLLAFGESQHQDDLNVTSSRSFRRTHSCGNTYEWLRTAWRIGEERAMAACAALDAPPQVQSADPLNGLKALHEEQENAARLARSAAESDSKFADLAVAFAEYATQVGDAVDAMEDFRSGETGGLDFINQLGSSLQEPTTVRQECASVSLPTGDTSRKPLS